MTQATLKTFFFDDPKAKITAAIKSSGADEVVDNALKGVGKVAQKALQNALDTALDEAFGLPLGAVLEDSWSRLDVIRDAISGTRSTSGAVVFAPLLEHAVTSRHQPSIDLVVAGRTIGTLPLEISLKLIVRGAEVEVRGGRMVGLRGGECTGEGAALLGGQPLKTVRKTFPMPGAIGFATRKSDG
jgi:hypothetical protein